MVVFTAGSSTVYYIHNDHLGTPQKITNASQQVVWAADYEPFGKANVTVDTLNFNTRFPGQHFDSESGLHYNYFRDYDPEIGRYIQSDPLGLYDGVNTYGYVYGNPVSNYDLLGLASSGQTKKLGGGNTVRIDNPHVPGQQKHAHVNTPKGEVVINQDGSQSHTGRGNKANLNKKMKKYLKEKGFKIPGVWEFLPDPCLYNPGLKGCPHYCDINPLDPDCDGPPCEA